MHIGTAGWSLPRATADAFPGAGTHLERYARVLTCAEINSSFYRSHRPEVYARWAGQTPRSWFAPAADRLLVAARVGRVAADPARLDAAALPGGWLGPEGNGAGAVVYYRWHGSPRTYWSTYSADWLLARAAELRRWPAHADCWCIFDNTASGAAASNALGLRGADAHRLKAGGPPLTTRSQA